MRKIKEGDRVLVWWVGSDVPSHAIIVHLPQGEGDYIEVEHSDGRLEIINQYSKCFLSIQKEPR